MAQYMPPSGDMSPPRLCAVSTAISLMTASVLSKSDAIEAAFCKA
jgi:hypothetical protein